MVKAAHEALHRIFQDDSVLFTRALRKALGVTLPTPRAISVINTDLTEIEPMERRADTILYVESAEADHIVIIESQTTTDDAKRRSWPYYIAYLHSKYDVPVTLLVVCPNATTAAWARSPIHIGLDSHASIMCRPLVLGPDNVPAIVSIEDAADDVVLTVFSALTHKDGANADRILRTLADALGTIDPPSAAYLAEFTEVGLAQTTAAQIWRSLLSTMTYPYQSLLRSQWRAEGRAEGEALSVLRVLDRRGVHVPDDARQRIMACTDTATLESWLDRALTACTIDDVFA